MIQEIKDRVPVNVLSNDAIRYGIYDENGNLIRYEYIKREDEPIETGTPINRALFSNIQGDLYTVDRYSEPTVTQTYVPTSNKTDKILSEKLIQEDCIPKNWTLEKYDSTTLTTTSVSGNVKLHYTYAPSYVQTSITGSSTFDGNENTYTNITVRSQTARAIIEFDRPVKIAKVRLKISSGSNGTFDLVGSDDNVTFKVLYPKITSTGSFQTLNIEMPVYYKYFGIKVGNTEYTSYDLYEIQVVEYYEAIFGELQYVNHLSLPLTSYEVGKIVRIKGNSYTDEEGTETTSFENPYININNLGVMPVKGTIYKNNYYNLVFDGAQFLLESSRIDVTNATILAETSGTYTLNPDITYDVVAIGGGGGSWCDWDDWSCFGGGAGGYIKGTISNTSSIDVTIGAGGKNVYSYRPWNADAGDGGTTTVGNLIAYGGTGAKSLGPAGEGGGYSGDGVGQKGSGAVAGTNGQYVSSMNGPTPTGWDISGAQGGMYGAGGRIDYNAMEDEGGSVYSGQDGVVAFIPRV